MMYVLGLNNNHNATATLVKNGRIIGCVSEERFTGVKNYTGIPRKAISYLLETNHLTARDLDLVCLGYQNGGPLITSSEEKKNLGSLTACLKVIFLAAGKIRSLLFGVRGLEKFLYRGYVLVFSRRLVEKEKKLLSDFLKIAKSKIISFDHHQTHAAAAYYSSPFRRKKVLVLTLDAEGDLLCASVNTFDKKGRFKRIAATPIGNSLAQIYKDVTQYLGMKPNEHEYKVMGLAPYAKKEGTEFVFKRIKNWVKLNQKNPLLFKAKFHTGHTYAVLKKELEGCRFDNIAAAFQKLIEERVLEWVTLAIQKTNINTLAFGGGIFMNVKLNQKILELKEIKEAFFMPSCGDESASIGAAFLGCLNLCQQDGVQSEIEPIRDLYWGPAYSSQEIKEFLKEKKYDQKYKVRKLRKPEAVAAKLLSQKKIVARLSGRMEWGARALGNRSILAHPSHFEIVRTLNEQIKNRDFWMPFTPSILVERASDYLVNPKKVSAPYMVVAFDSTSLARRDLKAAIHPYDFTVRPQVVEESWNKSYHRLIKEFERLTGVGAVLNTSFNLHGYPIVLGPREAMYVFENSGLNYLLLEDYLIIRDA